MTIHQWLLIYTHGMPHLFRFRNSSLNTSQNLPNSPSTINPIQTGHTRSIIIKSLNLPFRLFQKFLLFLELSQLLLVPIESSLDLLNTRMCPRSKSIESRRPDQLIISPSKTWKYIFIKMSSKEIMQDHCKTDHLEISNVPKTKRKKRNWKGSG
jgi:hypothetical protein